MSKPPAPPFTKTSRTSEPAQGFLLWQSVTAWFRFAFQCAVTVGATVLPVQGGRFVRPSPRSAYTYTPSGASPAQLASPCFGPLGKTPTVTARGILGSSARCSVARPLTPLATAFGGSAFGHGCYPAPCAAAPVVFAAIRAAMLRRRNTGSSPCDVSHRASDEPRRRMSLSSALAPSSLASPSIGRVFLRSFCARRRPVDELNLPRDKFAPRIAPASRLLPSVVGGYAISSAP